MAKLAAKKAARKRAAKKKTADPSPGDDTPDGAPGGATSCLLALCVSAGLLGGFTPTTAHAAEGAKPLVADTSTQVLRIADGSKRDSLRLVIDKNTTIPVSAERSFTTTADMQEVVRFEVFQGESDDTRENACLGQFLMGNLPEVQAGQVEVVVSDPGGVEVLVERGELGPDSPVV